MRSLRVAPLLLAGLLAAGCSGKGSTGGDGGDTQKSKVSDLDLKRIGIAYHSHYDAKKKGPAKAEDLGPFTENDERLIGLLKNGDIFFIYNVSFTDMKEFGPPDTVLGYVKDVPDKGGLVLLGDGSTKRMSADEFKKAHIAKGKP